MSAYGIELARKIYSGLGQRASLIAHSMAVAFLESRERCKKEAYNTFHRLVVLGKREYTGMKDSDLDRQLAKSPGFAEFVQEGYVIILFI